jgi:rod shape determining protein RodA
LVPAIARYFHGLVLHQLGNPHYLIEPALGVVPPAALVLQQPDPGTTVLLLAIAGAPFVLVGVRPASGRLGASRRGFAAPYRAGIFLM